MPSQTSNDYKVVCQLSGFVCLRSQCKRRWDGLLVRADFWEPRQPQDFVKVPKESPPPKDVTGEPPTQTIDVPPITVDQLI